MEIARYWRLQGVRYGSPAGGLVGGVCDNPDHRPTFPPRRVCPECMEERLAEEPTEFAPEIEQFLAALVVSQQQG